MRLSLLRPRWLAIHLAALLIVCGCATLGYWQFLRAQQPTLEQVTNQAQDLAAARDVTTVLHPGEYIPASLENQAITATGRYDTEAQLLVPARHDGERGYYVIVPLVTAADTAITVNRGFIDEATAAQGPPPAGEGRITVRGWLLSPQEEGAEGYSAMSVPDGQAARIAPALLVNEWPYQLYAGYLNLADQNIPPSAAARAALQPVDPPEPPTEIDWDWGNVSYAAQWWVFGGAAIVFWVSLVRRELRSGEPAHEEGEHAGGDGESSPSCAPQVQRFGASADSD
ncbi:SURF1 family protein [Salinactinospora qingdaonensis]|uniref:SURF1-like protein n=1 Tax=Salinactinospora qingdaonensis TaxID=702744 RepID=A0ABP7F7I1_9ACTN